MVLAAPASADEQTDPCPLRHCRERLEQVNNESMGVGSLIHRVDDDHSRSGLESLAEMREETTASHFVDRQGVCYLGGHFVCGAATHVDGDINGADLRSCLCRCGGNHRTV